MTEEDLDRVHADSLLDQKRVSADLKAAERKLDGMLRDWHNATRHESRILGLAVNEDGRLIYDRSILPTEGELIEALKSHADLKGRLDAIERKLEKFS